jgi:murein L,D-transpeptidase YcbB/YkuD
MKMSCSGFAAALLTLSVLGCGGEPDRDDLTRAVRSAVESDASESVRAFYAERGFEPAFVGADVPDDRLPTAIDMFCRSWTHGLIPEIYLSDSLRSRLAAAFDESAESGSDEARGLGDLDVALTSALIRYASDVVTGRVDPREVSSTWNAPLHRIDPASVVAGALEDDSLESIPARVSAMHEQYERLRGALARYRSLEQAGGWRPISEGESLDESASGTRVRELIERLAAEGDLDSTALADTSHRYTPEVAEAVRSVQRRFGLDVDGVAGSGVVEALNVPIADRIEQIEINMERWRWIPGHLGSRYLYVNIPAFELHAFEGGREIFSMPVVVGEVYEESATPVFSDTMEYVVFNPYWNVPESIAETEIVPQAREDRSYLARNEYEVVTSWSDDADVLDPMEVDLDRVADGTYRIRQKPGPENALGRIKFMFPNDFNIYLHDTPAEYLFDRADRAYSHGCIRVERPEELAEFVLRGGEWTSGSIQEEIESSTRSTVSLPEPLPVYILYWTAFVDDGSVHFREDLYGNDAELRRALEDRSTPGGASCDAFRALLTS